MIAPSGLVFLERQKAYHLGVGTAVCCRAVFGQPGTTGPWWPWEVILPSDAIVMTLLQVPSVMLVQ